MSRLCTTTYNDVVKEESIVSSITRKSDSYFIAITNNLILVKSSKRSLSQIPSVQLNGTLSTSGIKCGISQRDRYLCILR